MYTIPTKELKRFFSASSFVESSGALPILDFMLIRMNKDGATLYRTDLDSYYIQFVDVQNTEGDVVVEYKGLGEYVKNVSSDAITFNPKDNKILISDGSDKLYLPTMDGNVFPRIPVINTVGVPITEEAILKLKRASLFLNKETHDMFTTNVFIGNNYICASDRNFAFYASVETSANAPFYKKIISALPGQCTYSVSENYHTFSTLNSVYLFSKNEASFHDMTTVPGKRPSESVCVIQKNLFLNYLTIARSQCRLALCIVDIKGGKQHLFCHMLDNLYGAVYDKKIEAECTDFEFRFNADYMLTIVKQFTGDILNFYISGHALYINDEHNNFLTIIMQIHDIDK